MKKIKKSEETPSILRVLHEVVGIDEEIKHIRSNDPDFEKKMQLCRAKLSIANAKIRCLGTLKACADNLTNPKNIERRYILT